MTVMSERFTLEQVREYWTQQAIAYGQSLAASWSDLRVIEMEIKEISKYLADGDDVLDVGCGNGFSTVQFAAHKDIHILGVDHIPTMIENAQQRLSAVRGSLRGHAEFAVGDILQLKLPDERFDKVISIRVIINLGDWSNQLRGLHECVRVLRTGGILLLSEATLRGWQRMNTFRKEWGLPEIPMPAFNNYLDEEQVVRALSPYMDLQNIVNFSSTYYVGTRVLKPLLAQACELDINVADPMMEWNRWFSQLPAAGDYGTQKLFVFRKK
jgi:ubiquinone/menaquinone biosynthesis C-methylase UbiE